MPTLAVRPTQIQAPPEQIPDPNAFPEPDPEPGPQPESEPAPEPDSEPEPIPTPSVFPDELNPELSS